MLRALRDRTYRRLYLAQIVALLGTGLATVALGLLAYDISPARRPARCSGRHWRSRWSRTSSWPLRRRWWPRLPVGGPGRRGPTAALLVDAVSLPFVGEVRQIFALIFVLQAASTLHLHTHVQSLIPDVLPDEENTAALSLSRLAYDLESVISPMLAAALLLVVSSQTLFFGTAVGFAASAALVVSGPGPAPAG